MTKSKVAILLGVFVYSISGCASQKEKTYHFSDYGGYRVYVDIQKTGLFNSSKIIHLEATADEKGDVVLTLPANYNYRGVITIVHKDMDKPLHGIFNY